MSAFRFIPPCSPIRAAAVPAGDGWAHEVKFDGYRVQAHKVGSRVVIFSRNGHDFTERFPSLAQLLQELPARSAVVDGEVDAAVQSSNEVRSRITGFLRLSDDSAHRGKHVLNTVVEFGV
jgi:ATP-dependent DNA ligase